MTLEQLINVLVVVALVELMAAIGLGVKFADVVGVVANGRLLVQAAIANYVLVPAIAVGLLLLVRPAPMVAAGFLIAAVCPGAPYGPPLTTMAKGNVTASVGLMVVLAASSALAAPLLLQFLLPWMHEKLLTSQTVEPESPLRVDAAKMIFTLLVVQILPLCAGLAVRGWLPARAARLLKPANLLSAVLNVTVIGLVLALHFQTFLAIRPIGFAGMFALVLAALAVGWLFGMPGRGNRTAMAITTSVRNVGVALVIATSSFPGTAAVTATLVFALFQTILMAIVAIGWGRLASIDSARSTPRTSL